MSRLESDGNGGFTPTSSLEVVGHLRDHADSYVSSASVPRPSRRSNRTVYLVRRGAEGAHAGHFRGLGLRGNDSSPVAIERITSPAVP